MARVVLLTGGNVGDVKERLRTAQRLVNARIGAVLRCSHCYGSAPWGFEAEQPFVNQVLVADTDLAPHEVLAEVHRIEVISTPELTIPHPGIAEREFVLTPLCEVLRQRPHPVLGLTMGELRDNLLRKTK